MVEELAKVKSHGKSESHFIVEKTEICSPMYLPVWCECQTKQ